MAKERNILDKLFLFIKGLSMGAANKVPGVSGGMVSFVLGFYEEMIYSFRKINIKAFKLLFNGRFKSFYYYVNAPFLLLIFMDFTGRRVTPSGKSSLRVNRRSLSSVALRLRKISGLRRRS